MTYSTHDVSERIVIPVSTIKLWADRLGIGTRNSLGQRRFSDKDLVALELVKTLRDSDCGFETITRQLALPLDLSGEGARQRELFAPPDGLDEEALVERLTAAMLTATKADNDLAERYALATHRIGELETDLRHLQQQAQRLMTDGHAEADRQRARADRLEAERDDLLRQLAERRARPWWRWLLSD